MRELQECSRTGRSSRMTDLAIERACYGQPLRRLLDCRSLLRVVSAENRKFFAALLVPASDSHLDRLDGRGIERGLLTCLADHPSGCLRARAARTHSHAADHAADPVAGCAGIGKAFEDEHDGTLARHVASARLAIEHRGRPLRQETTE